MAEQAAEPATLAEAAPRPSTEHAAKPLEEAAAPNSPSESVRNSTEAAADLEVHTTVDDEPVQSAESSSLASEAKGDPESTPEAVEATPETAPSSASIASTTLTMPDKVEEALRIVHQAKFDDASPKVAGEVPSETQESSDPKTGDFVATTAGGKRMETSNDESSASTDSASSGSKPTLPPSVNLLATSDPKPHFPESSKDRSLEPPPHTPVPASPTVSITPTDPIILGLAVVDFNHLIGPQVEYAHPKELLDDEDLVKSLPFLALPDGSHLSDEDFCYFHLNCPKLSDSTIFGISCNRQIASDALLKKGAEVTRSTVQKAVVVLAKEPVFGPIREKLGIVTRAFFAQGDLGDVDILVEFHATLEIGLQTGGLADDRDAVMYMGTSIRELVHKWHFKTLMLVKLLLLQRRIMFFGYPVERLCTYQYSLVSLIPGLLLSLQDAADPKSKVLESSGSKAESLRTSDRKSLMKYVGMPLNIFGEDSFFQPYCPLQQIDLLQSRSWLVGTSNSIFKQQKDCRFDVIVDLETSTLEFQDPRLQQIVGLTPADRKWMDEIVHTVNETWNPADPTRPTSMGYLGSDDYLRAKFEDYVCALLSSTRYADFLAKSDPEQVSITAPDASSAHHFGTEFLAALRGTNAFAIWQKTTDPMLFDIVDHKHPCEGKTSTIEDVGLRLSAGLHDLRLEENLGPTREAIGSAIQAGGANIYRLASNFRTDFAKFRATQLSGGGINPMGMLGGRGEGSTSASGSPDKEVPPTPAAGSSAAGSTLSPPASPSGPVKPRGTITGEAIDASGKRTSRSSALRPLSLVGGTTLSSTGGAVPTSAPAQPPASASAAAAAFQANANEAMTAASQAAAQAGTQVRAALGSFGSFLSSKQKAWSAARAASAAPSPLSSPAMTPATTTDTAAAKDAAGKELGN